MTVAAHWSSVAALTLFGWLLATGVLPAAQPGHSVAAYWSVGVAAAVVFFGMLLGHELAHAIAARHYGMRVRSITLWLLGGLTELDGDPPSPRADGWIAAAGPLTSIGIGLTTGALGWGIAAGGVVGAAVMWLAEINMIIGVFNLLPGAPLDGGRLLRAVLWRRFGDHARATAAAARTGRVLGVVLVTLGLIEVLAGAVDGFWLALIGWFVLGSAAAERDAAGVERLNGMSAADVMSAVVLTAPAWWTADQLLVGLWNQKVTPQVIPLVDLAGEPVGVVTLTDVQRAHRHNRGAVRIRDLARPGAMVTLPLEAPVADCARASQRGKVVVVVAENRRPVGVVTPAELDNAFRRAELSGREPQPNDMGAV